MTKKVAPKSKACKSKSVDDAPAIVDATIKPLFDDDGNAQPSGAEGGTVLATNEAAELALRWAEWLTLHSDQPAPVKRAALQSITVAVNVLFDGNPMGPTDCLTDLRTLLSCGSVVDVKASAMRSATKAVVDAIEAFLPEHPGNPVAARNLLRSLQRSPRWKRLTEADCLDALSRWTGGRPRKGELATVGVVANLALRCGAFGRTMSESDLGYGTTRDRLARKISGRIKQ